MEYEEDGRRSWESDPLVIRAKFPTQTGGGRIEIAVDMMEFFPCSRADLKKLLKTLKRDVLPERTDYNIRTVTDWLTSLLKHDEENQRIAAEDWVNCGTGVKEAEACLESKRHSNGVPLTDEDVKKLNVRLKELKRMQTESKKEFNNLASWIKKLKANLEILAQEAPQ